METCDALPKKPKRSFVEAWLSDKRYKDWIRKVSSDESLYFCTVCNKSFSCNAAHVNRHAGSACHRKNLKENVSLFIDDDVAVHVQHKTPKTSVFKIEWLDIDDFKLWLREVPHDNKICFCAICDKYFAAHLSHIRRHAESESHLSLRKKKDTEANKSNDDYNTQAKESPLSLDERTKSAEIKYAAFIAQKNIPHQTAPEILQFFQDIGQDPEVLQNMKMGRTKCKNIISNVLYPVENEHVVHNLQRTQFSVSVDETSDICNEKWMTFFARYIDPETLDVRSQLVKLINIDARDSSAEKLFNAFKSEMYKLQIPFLNIVALSCDNASVMTGKHLSFKTKVQQMCKHLLTFPCPCHSAALAAHAACAKIPSFCDEFIRKIASYINSSPKRTAIFHEFCDCFQDKYRKILKLSETRWLSRHACVERLLESWDTIHYFLQEMVVSEKSGEHLLSMMDNLEMKAYLLFLKYILNFFNAFNAFFQSEQTRIHLLQLKSANFLSQVCENFVKNEFLKDVATNINFSQKEIQKDINEIFLGTDCEEYLNNLMIEDHVDTVTIVRQNCLQFYLTAAEEIRKRLPITNDFLTKLQVFEPSTALFCSNRESSFQHVSSVAISLGGFDEDSLREEWFALPADFTVEEKENLSTLNFDEMWKEILQRRSLNNTYKYLNLRNLLSAVRCLPNSNADPERTFSVLTDLKSKKRNSLSSTTVNATCVLKSALKARGETAVNMAVTEQHLSRMSTGKLYAADSKREKSSLTLYGADEIASSSTT